jgi:hypothetical protein
VTGWAITAFNLNRKEINIQNNKERKFGGFVVMSFNVVKAQHTRDQENFSAVGRWSPFSMAV